MTDEDKPEAFLERWSRRKQAQAEPPPAEPPAASQPAQAKPAAPLPAVDSLKPDSDFTPFMARGVTPETRRAALKRLFVDAHFNVPDPFEPYSVDLTVSESIPEEMLKNLKHAERLLFDEPEKVAEAQAQTQAQTQAAPQPQTHETDLKNVAGKQDA